jgi:hypothetical protein
MKAYSVSSKERLPVSLTLLAIHTATSANSSRLLSLRGSRSQDLTTRPLRAPQNPIFLQQPGARDENLRSPRQAEGVNDGSPRERREEAAGEESKRGVLDDGPEVEPLRGNRGMLQLRSIRVLKLGLGTKGTE